MEPRGAPCRMLVAAVLTRRLLIFDRVHRVLHGKARWCVTLHPRGDFTKYSWLPVLKWMFRCMVSTFGKEYEFTWSLRALSHTSCSVSIHFIIPWKLNVNMNIIMFEHPVEVLHATPIFHRKQKVTKCITGNQMSFSGGDEHRAAGTLYLTYK